MSLPPAEERAVLSVAGDLLAQGSVINLLSLPLTVISLLAFLVMAATVAPGAVMAALTLACLAGAVQTFLALRSAFDARALRRLAGDDEQGTLSLERFDAALGVLGVMPAARRGRPVEARVRGALRLVRLQGMACAAQILALLASGWLLATGLPA